MSKFLRRIDEINSRYEYLKSLNKKIWDEHLEEFKKNNKHVENRLNAKQVIEGAAFVKSAANMLKNSMYVVMGQPEKWSMLHFDEQIIAGMAMYEGHAVEMQTGEGKTLAAVLPLFLHSINDTSSCCVTINDFLAQRDCEWMTPLYKLLNTSVGYIKNQQNFEDKVTAYKNSIIYGTASEFGFDYLRDHSSAYNHQEIINKKGNGFVLIDEIDHILINEAKTPLIISGSGSDASKYMYDLRESVEAIYKRNEDICESLLQEAHSIFDAHGWIGNREEAADDRLSLIIEEAAKKAWVVTKSSPENRLLLKMLEYANIRNCVDKWEVYFSYDHNKDEMHDVIQNILIVREDRTRDFELTEKGLDIWEREYGEKRCDFQMIDLVEVIEKIDSEESIDDEEKKIRIARVQKEDADKQEVASCLKNLLHAFIIMTKDFDYVVENENIILIDESTGRLQYGRRFSNGLHQAIESKERLVINKETTIIASITIQNFIRSFKFVAGMSGTVIAHEVEFLELYELEVIVIPSHKMSRKIDYPDKIFVTKREKILAIAQEVKTIHSTRRPILVGTYSIEEAEAISSCLSRLDLPYKLLSAKNHKLEAETVSKAGHMDSITIATNMSGRGTDIKLEEGVNDLGGMHVIVASRGKSKSQDLQFRGRQGRQGDNGSCQFFMSFEDDLLRTFQSQSMSYVLRNCRPSEGEAISSPLLSSAIGSAQERLSHTAFQTRKHSLDYDDILNVQRKQVYSFRDTVIANKNFERTFKDIIFSGCERLVKEYHGINKGLPWDGESFRQYLIGILPISVDSGMFEQHYDIRKLAEDVTDLAVREIHILEKGIKDKLAKLNINIIFNMDNLIVSIILYTLDDAWRSHIASMEDVRKYVQLRSIGQKDPLYEYRKEANVIFDDLRASFENDCIRNIFRRVVSENNQVAETAVRIKESLLKQIKNRNVPEELREFARNKI
ncbi:MAG: hypothetical protein KAH32_02445 [Chlamydiia bacterium]|nr:hypothetical protein [Chlamydiia bacterium]